MGRLPEWVDRAKVHVAMVLVGVGYGGYFVLTKACLSGGVDPFLFSTYRDGIGCVTLALYAVVLERHQWPKMTREVAGFILAMAIVGIYLQQTLFLFGLQYTNAIFSSIVMNCVPIWAFLIALIFRRDGQAKVLGIFFCIAGATILTLYKGPIIFGDFATMSPLLDVSTEAWFFPLRGWGMDSWRLGALCLLSCSMCIGSLINLQAAALRRLPAPFTLMAITTLLGTSMFATTAFFRLKEVSEWILSPGPELFGALYAGVVASGMCLFLSAWATHRSGPILIAAYTPMKPIFTTLLGVIFFNSALSVGSLLGAASVLTGLFLVVWGRREGLHLKALALRLPSCGKPHSVKHLKPTSLLVQPLLSTGTS